MLTGWGFQQMPPAALCLEGDEGLLLVADCTMMNLVNLLIVELISLGKLEDGNLFCKLSYGQYLGVNGFGIGWCSHFPRSFKCDFDCPRVAGFN